MDLGEAIAVALLDEAYASEDSVCSMEDEPVERENDLNDDFDETDEDNGFTQVTGAGIRFSNSSGKLGDALGGRPSPRTVALPGGDEPDTRLVTVAAHHLIPGKGSLQPSVLFQGGYLRTDGMGKGNIGYDVNSAPNGTWLPGNYAVRPWRGLDPGFQTAYAYAAIDEHKAQFHDAHEEYNTFVLGVLDKVADKLNLQEAKACPGERADEENATPLSFLVGRLDALSARMDTMLRFPTSNWHLQVFTSRFSLSYMMANPP